MNIYEVILIGLFVLGAAGFVTLVTVGAVRRARDKRTHDERLADENGDLEPGSFNLPTGYGAGGGQIGGAGGF